MSAWLNRHSLWVGRVLVARVNSKDCGGRLLPALASYQRPVTRNRLHQSRPQQLRATAFHRPETFLTTYCGFKHICTQPTILKTSSATFLPILQDQNLRCRLPRFHTGPCGPPFSSATSITGCGGKTGVQLSSLSLDNQEVLQQPASNNTDKVNTALSAIFQSPPLLKLPIARMYSTAHTTVDPQELKKFQAWALRWWDEEGVYSVLHSMNDLRVPFIRDTLISRSNNHDLSCPLLGVKLLDVGCGGGVLSEPLSRLGASVTGIDPLENNIRTAELHKSFDPELERGIKYKVCSLEELVDEAEEMFDVVVASEVVEHVADLESFIQCCHSVLRPGGSLFITTISKTTASYALGIVVAEKILGIVPDGTHDWEKFVTPEEQERLLESNGFVVETVKGMLYNPLSTSWSWMDNTSLNYALHAVKAGYQEQTISSEQAQEDPQTPT